MGRKIKMLNAFMIIYNIENCCEINYGFHFPVTFFVIPFHVLYCKSK